MFWDILSLFGIKNPQAILTWGFTLSNLAEREEVISPAVVERAGEFTIGKCAEVEMIGETKFFFHVCNSCQQFVPTLVVVGVVLLTQLETEVAHLFVQCHVGNFWTVVILMGITKEGAPLAGVLPCFPATPKTVVVAVDLEDLPASLFQSLFGEREKVSLPNR